MTEELKVFIETNVPKSKKKGKLSLASLDNRLAKEITEKLEYECKSSDAIFELYRGIRQHFTKFLKQESKKRF